MKINRTLLSWAALGAKIWATHWLLIVASLLVFSSVVLKWVDFAFSPNLSALKLPLLRNVGLNPHVYFLSYGLVAIALLVTGLVLLRVSGRLLALVAALLLSLCLIVPCQIAFQQPALLRRLITETSQVPLIRVFTKNYLPENFGPLDDVQDRPNLSTTWGRLFAACSFLGLGWYCFALGSLLIAIYSIGWLPGRRRTLTALVLISVPASVLAILLTRPLIAQHYFNSAWRAKAHGQSTKAIAYYRKAMSWDSWHAGDIDIYATVGDLERRAGFLEDSPEVRVSKAKELTEASEYERAIFEFTRAAEAGGALAVAARREAARTRVDLGLGLYRAGGIGAAVTNWQQALEEDPSQLDALLYLARGNYDLGRYHAALETIDRLLKLAGHDSVRADAYSLAGDCYVKLGQDADARHSYNLALAADPLMNHWALTGLIGE